MKKEKEQPKGFTCQCGKMHSYPLYVYAHWGEPLTFKCDECWRRYVIRQGRAKKVKPKDLR